MDVAGVRFSHSVVKFTGTEPEEIYRATLTVQNISSTSRMVHIYQSKYKLFRIIVKNIEKSIAPGVQISAIIEYSTEKREDATDACTITVDKDVINIPMFAFCSACDLSIDPGVDFGTVVANSKVLSKEISVANDGSLPGQFIIADKGNLPLTIIPRSGTVAAKTVQLVKVELCTLQPMVIDELVLVKLEGLEETTLKIKANIVEPFLELLDFSGQKLECVQFGGTYYGTSKQEQVILYNNSPEAIDWVAVMENDAAGSEVGTDLSLSVDAVLADKGLEDPRPSAYASALITCRPCQGILKPYNKAIVTLCFSPKEISPTKFQRKEDEKPKYREYALYVRFETVRSCDGFIQKSSNGSNAQKDQQLVELTLTGTGFPVNLKVSPVTEFDFKECLIGEKVNVMSTLRNDSPFLPLIFHFHNVAHFRVTPAKGKIKPGHSKDVVICFAAHQLGNFKVNQAIDIFGLVALPDNPVKLKMQSFHQVKITFTGVCKSTMKKLEPKFIPRITPAITKETGLLAQETTDQISKYSDSSPVPLLSGCESSLHSQNRSKNLENNAFVSISDGSSASIRPSNRHKKYISTKMKQHTYVDPEYTNNEEEVAAMKAQKKYYEDYLRGRRLHRFQKQFRREFEKYNNAIDIGMRPAEGLRSPKLSVKEIIQEKWPPKVTTCSTVQLIRTHKPRDREVDSTARPALTCSEEDSMGTSDHSSSAKDGLNAVPSSLQEEKDCSLKLTPQQLHQIVIGPSTVDFGNVCVHSTSMQNLNIVNSLPMHILIEVATDCAELRESSPLAQVIPPMSAAYLPLIFESTLLGVFQKSITYTINNIHTGHVLVLAKVVCVALELSSNELVLTPNYGLLAESGFRTTVRLYNRRNYPAQFSWSPILTEKGIAFFIRPDGGTVDAFNDLECEVVWHASFFSPVEGEFDLIVHQGNKIRLKCIAKLGHINVHFVENRVLFNAAPWNLSTMKTAILKNDGQNHAYFKIKNMNPVPGMTITPVQGTIPVGGYVRFKIFFNPATVFKFDTRIKVDIRNTNRLKLRVGGSVTRPMAEIDVKYFKFHGVYCGSTCKIPFTLLNLTDSHIKLEFDFSKYKDFALKFETSADARQDPLNSQLYVVDLGAKESIKCELFFIPTEVASYDFNLPVNINGSTSPSPPPSSVPSDPYDDTSIDSSRVQLPSPATPSRRVQATALCPPLELSTTKVEFSLLPGYNDLGVITADPFVKKLEIQNTSNREIKWMLDLNSRENAALEEGIFRIYHYNGSLQPDQRHCITVGFCPLCPGKYICEIPLFLNEDRTNPYRIISLSGIIHTPKLNIDPPFVIMNSVPLNMETTATVRITRLNYLSDCILQAEVPEVETEDGNWFKPLSCQFPEGSSLALESETNKSITCCITFCSFSPISISMDVIFIDQEKKRFKLPVSASTDNCLLTVYRYLSLHHTDQQIVLKTANNSSKHQSIGKVVLQPYYTPGTSSRSSSSIISFTASTFFEESVSDTCESGDSKVEMKNTEDDADVTDRKNNFGGLLFSAEDIDEDVFCQKVLTAVQTWFSLFGWSNGMHPISIPESLRSTKQVGKDTKTIYDMLNHLSGQLLPGITAKQSLPSDPVERILQLHWQHSTLLTFLKAQGACLAHVKPEFLFEPEEFKQWNQLQSCLQSPESAEILDLDDDVFESISKRSWTDMLLQIYKVLVLSRLTLKDINSIFGQQKCLENVPRINADPLSSNIYSTGELVLLTWLNFHYETMRNAVWECCQKGAIPPTRWIINFDLDLLDGLVLAAVLAAYCPDLISTHLENMYTSPAAPEQCLHNSLVLLNAFYAIGLDFDIQATDISDPNPIMMLMLCVYLYERLPNYLPKMTVEFTGDLHATIVKQVRLQNPIMRHIVYFATIVGKEAADFSLPSGNEVTVPERSHVDINVEFTSRFLNPEQALLVFVSRLRKGVVATTTTFLLTSRINNINPTATVKCESPCYEQKRMQLNITNPLNGKGDFRVILLETHNSLFATEDFKSIAALLAKLKMQNQKTNVKFSDLQSEPGEFEVSKERICENEVDDQNMNLKDSSQANWLPVFFSKVESLHLEARGSSVLEVLYLPFQIGKCYCTIFLVNEQIGEFVYCLEGTGCIPLPSTGLQVFSPSAIQNHCAASGNKNATQIVLYYKCNNACTFEQELKIPLINEAREKALATVGQQQMSEIEYKRRKTAGTLESSSVRASVAAVGLSCIEIKTPHSTRTDCTGPKNIDYYVEVSMPKRFESPDKISIPVSRVHRVNFKSQQTCGSLNLSEMVNLDKEDSAIIPMKFISKGPGRYPCQILLRSLYDIRLYNITCVVNPEDNFETELEMTASTHQSVIKNIPVHNETQEDWKIKAILEGKDFFGPSMLYIQACETSMYPLMFKPNFECVTMGKLVLANETDGTERIVNLKGVGKKPVAVDHVVIHCQVRQITKKVLMVPNYTQTKLTCKVVSDLLIVSGAPFITLKAGQTAPYHLNILPWKRGKIAGVISFMVEDEMQQLPECSSSVEKSDGEQPVTNVTSMACEAIGDANAAEKNKLYRVWFYLEIHTVPARPEQCLCVTCAVQDTIDVNIPISNPIHEPLTLDVVLNGAGITGDNSLVLRPNEVISYMARYTPSAVGESIGSVIFHSDLIGEFWYELDLIAKMPTPITLPELQCELGKWTRQFIPLANSTIETLELEIVNSNPGIFSVEIDPRKLLIVNPQSTTEVPVQFSPVTLGKANHCATIIFKCPQLQEWTFHLSGVGLLPHQMEPVSITACVNSHASVIVPFGNPTNELLLVDVVLTGNEQVRSHHTPSDLLQSINKEPVFCIPLKQKQGILLPPKGKLDIPLIFAPDEMALYEGLMVVQIKKENGNSWPYDMSKVTARELKSYCRSEGEGISAIRWLYPLYGIPEALPPKLSPAVIQCQARNRVEEPLEVILTGAVPGSSYTAAMQNRVTTPYTCVQDEIQVTDADQTTTEEFLYEIQYETEKARIQMESTVAISFVKKKWDTETGIVTLIFNIVFAPYKPIRHPAMLKVQSATGGIWKFPLLLIATEPQVDDIINIEASGLNKESVVCFRLTSQTRYPIPFTAHFLPCSDQEFVVSPQTGELLPLGSTGTLITVGFTPRMYSRKHEARLVIQTVDMQWMYEINGLDPKYTPPNIQCGKTITTGFRHSVAVRQRNFIRENLKVIATAVSSPLKGAPLVTISKTIRTK
ncbi:cilia- and flagella-associated protein 47-like [Heptranchias perlo]|uniref:cilia- and flagella-associated protein 47-like n=1 Tax=Heptranchias perlo TaxID=212740 RepID=UPI00355A68BA